MQDLVVDRLRTIVDGQNSRNIGVNDKTGQGPQQMFLVIGLFPTASLSMGYRDHTVDAQRVRVGETRRQLASETRRAGTGAQHDDIIPRPHPAAPSAQISRESPCLASTRNLVDRRETSFVKSIGLDMVSEVRLRRQIKVDRPPAQRVEHALITRVSAWSDQRGSPPERQFPGE